jgi:hypothetical protein
MVAADSQPVGPEALDVQALGDRQLPPGQSDGLALETVVEDDLVAALGSGDHRPQRAIAIVGRAPDRQGTEHRSLFEFFEPQAERAPRECVVPVGLLVPA